MSVLTHGTQLPGQLHRNTRHSEEVPTERVSSRPPVNPDRCKAVRGETPKVEKGGA